MEKKSYDPAIKDEMSSQCKTLFEYMQTGRGVSRVIADHSLNIASVSRRINDLESIGVPVLRDAKREGVTGRRYVVYRLPKSWTIEMKHEEE